MLGDDAKGLGPECFRLAPANRQDELPWLTDAQVQLKQRGEQQWLQITTRYSVQHPVLMVGIIVGCGAQVRRDFTLLLGPAGEADATLATSQDVSPPQTALTAPPATARPKAPRHEATASRPQKVTRAAPTPRAAEAPVRQASPAHHRQDRLQVARSDGDLSLQPSYELGGTRASAPPDDATRARLRQEQQLVLAIDDRITGQMELAERIRQLEYAQQRLLEENKRLQAAIEQHKSGAVSPAPPAGSAPARPWLLIALIGGGLLAAIGATLYWRRRRADEAPAPLVEARPFTPGASAQRAPDLDVDFDLEPLTAADIWPDRSGEKPTSELKDPTVDWAPATLSPATLGPSSLLHIDDAVDEHDSAVELAEIMMSFGRVHGAAETLADFIRANPKQAVKPWVKLLEVYRAASMRVEFDALAQQLNKTFNVKAVRWEDFEEVSRADDSLEQMGHIIGRIVETWGTRACQTYIHTLLRDNRKGTRQGFPLGIVDDLLCLNGVLESQLGSYRPTPEEEAAAAPQPPANTAEAPTVPTTTAPTMQFTPPDAVLADPDLPPLPKLHERTSVTTMRPYSPVEPPQSSSESMIEFNLDEEYPPLDDKDE